MSSKTRLFALLFALLLSVSVSAQKTLEQMGGVYYAYPAPPAPVLWAIPEGFTPVYLSHYGRHGSRWLPSDSRYEWVVGQFQNAGNLTREGRRLKRKLDKVWLHARGNGGRLTPVGVRQQQRLARRMVARLPQLFGSGAKVEARSSVVDRCRKSMEAFVGEMETRVPGVKAAMATDSADMRWMSYDSPDEMLLQMETRVELDATPDRLMRLLFRDPSKVKEPVRLFSELYTIASDMQDVDGLRVSLYDLFTRPEIEALYRQACARMWHQNGTGTESRDIPAQCAARLWANIVAEADSSLRGNGPVATLRFGHDTALYRLLSLLRVSSVVTMGQGGIAGPLDEIVPMAANLQMLFCRDTAGETMVALWLNEQPQTLSGLRPVVNHGSQSWYRWTDIKTAYAHHLGRQQWMERTRDINTMVGTDYAVTQTAGYYGKGSEEHGQTIPAVLEPHGQTFWTPQTQATELKCVAPYYYRDSLFQGFRASHWLVGGCTQDYGSFTLMPMTGTLRLKSEARATRFRHEDELAHPYYYGLYLPDEHLMTEMTGRSHSAIFRFMPDRAGEMHIVIQPNSDEQQGFVTVDTLRNCVWGYNPVHRIYQGWGEPAGFSGWFVVQFQRPIKRFGVRDTVAFVTIETQPGEMVLAKAATSFTSVEGAWDNLRAEIPAWDFLGTRLALDSIWQDRLKTIEVESADEAKVNQFYGALYRSSFLPRTFSDVDGSHPAFAVEGGGRSDRSHESAAGVRATRVSYMDFSMWDIYRAQMPLLNIIDNRRAVDMAKSLVDMYRRGGWMPIFPCWNSYTAAMIGDHGASVLVDVMTKNPSAFSAQDWNDAYEGLRKNAFESPKTLEEYKNGMGRRALKSYLRYGYIPMEDSVTEAFHTHEQVSRTLEYAYDDFCVAQMAKYLGKTDDYRRLMVRAGNWRNAINPRSGWADGRYKSGRWLNNQDLTSRVPFITEGAVVHYSFYVPQDVYGLISAMGGKARFAEKLDTLWRAPESERFYWHGNEPCHQIPYMYVWAGEPWKTQQWVREILQTEYLDVPGGLSGNDDAGQMSAWYVFSALGFYPVCPGTPYYIIGSPSFRRAQVGRFVAEATAASDKNVYIQSVTWNGQPYTKTYITHDMITRGGTLRIVMGPQPNKGWGTGSGDLPPASLLTR